MSETIAEKIIRESVCMHGPGAECSEYHEQDIIDRIDSALRQRELKVRAEERDRAAKILEDRAKQCDEHIKLNDQQGREYGYGCWRDIADALRHSATAIRRDSEAQEGEQHHA